MTPTSNWITAGKPPVLREPCPVFMVTYRFHGKLEMAVFYDSVPHSVRHDKKIGGVYPVVDITELGPEYSLLPFAELRDRWVKNDLHRPQDPTRTNEKDSNMLERLKIIDGIIRTSQHEGERDNARRLFRKLTGQDWRE